MKFNKLIPELIVSKLSNSLNFYMGILGFKLEYERKENKFAFLSLEGSQLMIQEGLVYGESKWFTGKLEKPFGRGLHFQIEVKNVIKLLNSLNKNKYPIRSKLEDNWYRKGNSLIGMKSFLVQDPDGYLLMFNQNIGIKKII